MKHASQQERESLRASKVEERAALRAAHEQARFDSEISRCVARLVAQVEQGGALEHAPRARARACAHPHVHGTHAQVEKEAVREWRELRRKEKEAAAAAAAAAEAAEEGEEGAAVAHMRRAKRMQQSLFVTHADWSPPTPFVSYADGPWPPPPPAAADEEELYCLCRQPYNEEETYICCDICEEWFHALCVQVMRAARSNVHGGRGHDAHPLTCTACGMACVWHVQINPDWVELVGAFVCPACETTSGMRTTWLVPDPEPPPRPSLAGPSSSSGGGGGGGGAKKRKRESDAGGGGDHVSHSSGLFLIRVKIPRVTLKLRDPRAEARADRARARGLGEYAEESLGDTPAPAAQASSPRVLLEATTTEACPACQGKHRAHTCGGARFR